MSFFQQVIDKIFPRKKSDSSDDSENVAQQPYIQEEIKRTDKYMADYQLWKESDNFKKSLEFIAQQFAQSKNENEDFTLFRVLRTNSSNGFMLRYLEEHPNNHLYFIADYLNEQVKKLGYIAYQSDRRIFDRIEGIEKIERHYLKPSWRKLNLPQNNSTGKMNQLYGNVTIEVFSLNDAPSHLKLMVNNYIDSKFQEALPFEDLMNAVLNDEV